MKRTLARGFGLEIIAIFHVGSRMVAQYIAAGFYCLAWPASPRATGI